MGYGTSIRLIGATTVATGVVSRTVNTGEYRSGTLFVHVSSMGGTAPRLYANWQESPNGTQFVTMVSAATGLVATGLAAVPLSSIGLFGRCGFTLGGSTPIVTFEAWAVLKAW